MATQAENLVQEELKTTAPVDMGDLIPPSLMLHDITSNETKQNTVTMATEKGQEKSREQLQEEVTMLKDKLTETEETVKKTQSNLKLQQTRTKQLISIWKTHVERNEENLKRQGMERDQQLGEVISQLLFFEGQLRKEQKRIVTLLSEKDLVIEKQEERIQELMLTNSKLFQALGDVKAISNKNGVVNGHKSPSAAIGSKPAAPQELSLPPDIISRANPKDKGQQKPISRFAAVKNRLRRHKSNLELRNIENTILEETAEELSSSQENIVIRRNNPRRNGRERCKSIAGYPIATDPGLDRETMETCELESQMYRAEMERDMNEKFQQLEQANYENELFDGQGDFENVQDTLQTSSSSNMLTVNNSDQNFLKISTKDRVRSASSSDVRMSSSSSDSVKSNSLDSRKSAQAEGKSSPISESNPFKTFRSMLKRKGSKLKKKRSVSLPQTTNTEYYEALKYHLDKENKTKK